VTISIHTPGAARSMLVGRAKPWWEHDRDRDKGPNPLLAQALIDTVQDIERRQMSIHQGHRRHARLYSGYLPNGLSQGAAASSNSRQPFTATKAVVRSLCDTAHALIVRTRPRASFVTDGANWDVAKQAEDMDQFTTGAYDRAGVYQVAPRCFHDTTWSGTGAWTYVTKGKGDDFRVLCERVLVDDLIIDEEECREHLEPQNVYHRVQVRADVLINRYCPGNSPREIELRAKILAARGAWPQMHVPADRVVLVRAYHMDPDGDDHRKVLSCNGVVLADEKWPHPWPPFTFLWWAMPITGFYGDGIAYRQLGRQERISYMYRWIHRCHELLATPTAWVDPAGGPPAMHMNNEIGRIIQTRRPPVFQVHQVVPPEIYKWLDELEQGAFDDEGISRHMATNQLPPGVDSAPAQRELVFKEGQRFAPVSQRWEWAVGVDTATKLVGMYRHEFKRSEKKVKVRWADQKFIHQVSWPDLAEDQYVIRPEAANLDSLSPAARTQSALELAQTGWITPQQGLALLDHPDLRAQYELDNAGENYAKRVLLGMIKGNPRPAVDEHADLMALERIIRRGRLLCITKDAPAEITDEMARFLDDLDAVKLEQAAKAQAMMMPGPMDPGAAGASPAMAPPEAGTMSVPPFGA
jgi:hypothetical protein